MKNRQRGGGYAGGEWGKARGKELEVVEELEML